LYLPIAASLLYYTLPVYLDIIFLHNIFFLSLSHDTTHSYSLFSFLFFPFSGVRFTARYVKVSFFFFFFSKYLFISGVYSSFLFVKFPHFFSSDITMGKNYVYRHVGFCGVLVLINGTALVIASIRSG